MENKSGVLSRDEIQSAFDNSEFFLVLQPQISFIDESVISAVEVFVRLKHPIYGTLGPVSFVPIVEKMGMLAELTKVVVILAADIWRKLKEAGQEIRIAINLEESLLAIPGFISDIHDQLTQLQIPDKQLTFELIAPNGYNFDDSVRSQMMNLRLKGYRLSLNDVHSLGSEINNLKTIPIDELKIPVSLISQIRRQSKAQNSLRKIMYAANQYGLSVVAVGVEHRSEVEWLKNQGIASGQGYLFGQPMKIEDFIRYLEQGTKQRTETTNKNLNLLIVEDDENYGNLLSESLGSLYSTHVAKSLKEARSVYEKVRPELILFDVHLPDGTGIKLCKELKNEAGNEAFSAVFLSGSDDPVQRLEAYEAGAIDFLVKPCPYSEIVTKMNRVAAYHLKSSHLETSQKAAQNMAVESMREASYYGDIIQFIKNLLHCRDEHGMAQALFSFMIKKHLTCAVEMRGTESTSNFTQNSPTCNPMEINVFELLKKRGRIFEFGGRAIFNDAHISILIKNLPDDEAERGRIRDYAAVIIESMEARYQDILRHRVLNTIFQQLQSLASDLVSSIERDQDEKSKLLEQFSMELGGSFHILDLNEEQEFHLTKIIENMLSKKEQGEVGSDKISERINGIMDILNDAMDKIDSQSQTGGNTEPNDSVELF